MAKKRRPQSDPTKKPFTPETLDRTVIAIPLLDKIEKDGLRKPQNVIIDINLEYPDGREKARELAWKWIDDLGGVTKTFGKPAESISAGDQGVNPTKSRYSQQYLFGQLSGKNIRELARRNEKERQGKDQRGPGGSAIYRIWLDHEVSRFTNQSLSTVKADAARNAFGALGKGIVWAVVDTGVDRDHPHFDLHKNLDIDAPLRHRDFTGTGRETDDKSAKQACTDKAGHGTHVAGIIAGKFQASNGNRIVATVRQRDESGVPTTDTIEDIKEMSGMAPECKILSLKVLDDEGKGLSSSLIAALEYIQDLNGNGRRIRIHGVNMSVGYDSSRNGSRADKARFASRSTGLFAPAWSWSLRPAIPAMATTSRSPGARWRRGKTSPSTIRATRIWRSRWARPIATCRTSTECRTFPRRDQQGMDASSRTSWRPERRSFPVKADRRGQKAK
jgi:serine protease AprX